MSFPGDRIEVRIPWRPTARQYLREVQADAIACADAIKIYNVLADTDLRALEQLGSHLLEAEVPHDPQCPSHDPQLPNEVVNRLSALCAKSLDQVRLSCEQASQLHLLMFGAKPREIDRNELERLVSHIGHESAHDADCIASQYAEYWVKTGTCLLYKLQRS